LFPAEIKSSLFAFCNIIARSLCMLAPVVAEMNDPIPFYFLGGFSLVALIST
jgi:hypothetical protein